MSKKAKVQQTAEVKENKKVDRVALNDKARYDYGILNAADMSDKQLQEEIAAIDKQAEDGRKENARAAKENSEKTISDSNGGVPAQPAV